MAKSAATPRSRASIRRKAQTSAKSARALAAELGVNFKTVLKWRNREGVSDLPTGRPAGSFKALDSTQELMIFAFRLYTQLPIDDCAYAAQAFIPGLTRSSLYRCLRRHELSRLPRAAASKDLRKLTAAAPLGHFRIDVTKVGTKEGPLFLFIASDPTTMLIFGGVFATADKASATAFLRTLLSAVPYTISSVSTARAAPYARANRSGTRHPFEALCKTNQIRHLIRSSHHPWGRRQLAHLAGLSTSTAQDQQHFGSRQELIEQNRLFLRRYNFTRRLKRLKGATPYQFICNQWARTPELFWANPHFLSKDDTLVFVCEKRLHPK